MNGAFSKYRCIVALSCVSAFLAAPSKAQNQQPIPKLPILENTTIVLGRIDLKQIDFDGLSKWLADGLATAGLPEADLQVALKGLQSGIDNIRTGCKAMIDAGAPVAYLAFSDPNEDPYVYCPVVAPGTVDAVRIALRNGRSTGSMGPNPETAQPQQTITAPLGDGVFMGRASVWKRLRDAHTGAPHLVFALGNAPAAPIQFVAAPSEDLSRVLEERTPQIPAPIDMPMTTLTRGIASAVLTGQLPPNGSARLLVQATDAQSAAQLKTVVDKYLALMGPLMQRAVPDLDFQQVATLLTPQVKDDQIVLAVNEAQVKPLFKPAAAAIVASLRRAKQSSLMVQSASNIRQISQAIIRYSSSNAGAFPDKLDQLDKTIPPQALINPRGGAAQPDYIYRKPAAKIGEVKTPGQTIIVYENPEDLPSEPTINLGYADGHVAAYGREQAIKMIQAQDAAAPAK